MDASTFRMIMGSFPTGVTVVTGRGKGGAPFGFTANSLVSVSLDPLLLLISLSRRSLSLERILASGAFVVNILGEGHAELARRFAGSEREGRFDVGEWEGEEAHAIPRLADAVAWLSCTVSAMHEAGDHVLILGEVREGHRNDVEPLVFQGGRFRSLGAIP